MPPPSPPSRTPRAYYYLCLCPGTLHLTTTTSKRHATTPILTPALLATNRQIHHEASDLLLANEVCLVLDAHDTSWPIISETRLSQSTLERLEHVFIILDCTSNFRADYQDVDFTALEALTQLKTLRVAVMYDEAGRLDDVFEEFDAMIEVLSRIPSTVMITCNVDGASQQAQYLGEAMKRRMASANKWSNGNGNLRNVVPPRSIKTIRNEVLTAAVDAVDPDMRGSKSGGNSDVFAAYRAERGAQFGARFSGQSDFAV